MSAKEDLSISLEPNCYYYIFNKGNNSDNLFYIDDYFKGLVWYIHNNTVKHKVYND